MRKLFTNIKGLYGIHEGAGVLKGAQMDNFGFIDNAFLALEDDQIVGYGSMDEWEGISDWRDLEVIDASEKYIVPTFCDSHTHLVFAATREKEFEDRIKGLTYQEIAQRGGGILNSVAKLRGMSEDQLFQEALPRLNQAIQMGTGAIEIKSGYGLDVENELKMLRVAKRLKEAVKIPVKTTLLAAHAFPVEFKENPEGYVRLIIEEIIPAVAKEGLADYIDVFCEEGYFSNEQSAKVLEAGAKVGMRAKVHVNQFTSTGGLQMAIEQKALSADHLEEMSEQDIKDVLGAETLPVALPSCSFFLNIPYTPARKIIDAGGPLVLATDYNPGTTPSVNMEFLWSLACIKMRMTPMEGLAGLTQNGAASLELDANYGSIGIGKKANFILTKEITSFAFIPYAFAESCIEQVYIDGEICE